ncbi:MAG: hypothetical protein Q8O30_01445 [Candidatus Omnitrophota bacterium]|nr:hypothetical protein [Candidatus Omnitrophota bacterium]
MNKEDLLRQIKEAAAQKFITKEEIVSAYDAGVCPVSGETKNNKSIAEIISYIGGTIVVLGIAIFIGQHWTALNTATRILVTFGSGIAAYITGAIFSRYDKFNLPAQAFFLISALTVPVGISIAFDNAGWNVGDPTAQSLISGILFFSYFLSYFAFKKNIFTIFNIIFGTWLFFSFTDFILKGSFTHHWKVNEYRMLAIGLSYVLLGYHFSQVQRNALAKWLYAIGVLMFLGAALALGGWSPKQDIIWELLFPGICFGVMFLSVYLKSRSFLVFGALFLIAYFLKITAEYFAKSLGWPLALVLLGLTLILVGYFSFYLNKKYLS